MLFAVHVYDFYIICKTASFLGSLVVSCSYVTGFRSCCFGRTHKTQVNSRLVQLSCVLVLSLFNFSLLFYLMISLCVDVASIPEKSKYSN